MNKLLKSLLLWALLLIAPTMAENMSLSPPYTPGQVVGVPNSTAANAGSVGEYLSATCTSVALTTNIGANCNSLALTAGDWDVWFDASFTGNAATVYSYMVVSLSTTSGTPVTNAGQFGEFVTGGSLTFTASSLTPVVSAGPFRQLIAGATTIYGVCQAGFTVNTATCSGRIWARRVR